MKNTLLLIGLTALSIVAVAQKTKHPAKAVATQLSVIPSDPVLLSYNQKFPENAVAGWAKSAGGNFIAQFDKGGLKHTAEFAPDGKWVRTKTTYTFEQLPEAVQKSVKEKYPDASVTEAHKIMMESVPPFYKLKIKKEKDGWIVWVNDAGIIRA